MLDATDLANFVVHMGDRGANDDLILLSRVLLPQNTRYRADRITVNERLIGKVEPKARHTVRGKRHVGRPANCREYSFRCLFVVCHTVSFHRVD